VAENSLDVDPARTVLERLHEAARGDRYRFLRLLSQSQTGDPPGAFWDYLRYLWVADGERGWEEFGPPVYSTREAWAAFVSARLMSRYR
jgi:hypothetical protein